MFISKLVPIKREYFERDEGAGTLLISNTGIDDSIIINSTAAEILNLIDGNKRIVDIIECMSKKYSNIEYKTIKNDLDNVLKNLYKRDIIYFESEDIMEDKNIISIFKTYKVEKLSEIDFKKIINYLSSKNKKIQYINNYNNVEYTEIMIRNRLFKYMEEFFALRNNEDKIIALVSFYKNTTSFGCFYLNGILAYNENIENDSLSHFIKDSSLYLYNERIFNCKKIRFSYYYRNNNILKEPLEEAGYISILKEDEYLIGDLKEGTFDFRA